MKKPDAVAALFFALIFFCVVALFAAIAYALGVSDRDAVLDLRAPPVISTPSEDVAFEEVQPMVEPDFGRICVALAVFYEARSEGWDGQAAVASVVVNRSRTRGISLCEVVQEKGQFEGVEMQPYPRRPEIIDRRAWEIAQAVADAVVDGHYVLAPESCANATSFHRAAPHDESLCVIGAHAFH